jgi:hypothetical protein
MIKMDEKKVSTQKPSYESVYQWACRLTAEQGEEDSLWTEETSALLNRLKNSKGNMIAVIGLQGTGKTALRQALYNKLYNSKLTAYSIKWVGPPEETIIEGIRNVDDGFLNEYDEEYLTELFEILYKRHAYRGEHISSVADKIVKDLGVRDPDGTITSAIERHIEGERSKSQLMLLLPYFERAVGSKTLMEVRKGLLRDKLETADVILIDLPDYDRSNIRQMTKDLTAIQEWWEGIFTSQVEGYEQNVSLVIFFQKELFQGHFFMGKLDVYELKPLTPDQLLSCYKGRFKSFEPFVEEALKELAFLSRGIFRRFKKYVRICLDHLTQSKDINTITPDYVTQWITLDQLVKDMELELMTMFPKEKENRVLSVKLLRRLRENGPLTQSQITEKVFDGAKMKASRVLAKLEAWNYIKRERKGKENVISLA